jgi:vacuolar protein sorting-associated protein 13A/C
LFTFRLSIRNPLAVVVNALTMTLGNVNDAPLELNALAIKDMRLTIPELQARIAYHYRQDVLRQLYRILGSADFIGNPVGLFTNVSSGVSDIFYAPYNGVVMHGNRELGIGIAKVRDEKYS